MLRASGISGVTELVLDFDGNLARTITDTDTLAPLDTGDDVDFEITVSLPSITYTNDTELEILLEGASSDVELVTANLGDLLGAGRTIEDADLVVTPSRVESAIHNMDLNAIADVRDAINSPDTFLELTDTPDDFTGQGGMAVVVNSTGTALEFGAGGDTSSLSAAGYEWTAETVDAQPNLVLSETGTLGTDEVFRLVKDADTGFYNLVISGNVIAGPTT